MLPPSEAAFLHHDLDFLFTGSDTCIVLRGRTSHDYTECTATVTWTEEAYAEVAGCYSCDFSPPQKIKGCQQPVAGVSYDKFEQLTTCLIATFAKLQSATMSSNDVTLSTVVF